MEVLSINKISVYSEDPLRERAMEKRTALLLHRANEKTLIYVSCERDKKEIMEFLKSFIKKDAYEFASDKDCNISDSYNNCIFYNFTSMNKENAKSLIKTYYQFKVKVSLIKSVEDEEDEFPKETYKCFSTKKTTYEKPKREVLFNEFTKKYFLNKAIYNNEIDEAAILFINLAQKKLLLSCPWFNNIVFLKYEDVIGDAVKRGIEVIICYGYSDNDSRLESTERVVKSFKSKYGNYNNLIIKEVKNHAVIVMFDEDYYIHSSKNIFSSDGSKTREHATVNRALNKEAVDRLWQELDLVQ